MMRDPLLDYDPIDRTRRRRWPTVLFWSLFTIAIYVLIVLEVTS